MAKFRLGITAASLVWFGLAASGLEPADTNANPKARAILNIAGITNDFPRAVYFMSWNGKWSLARNKNTRELLMHPWVLNRDDLPPGLVPGDKPVKQPSP